MSLYNASFPRMPITNCVFPRSMPLRCTLVGSTRHPVGFLSATDVYIASYVSVGVGRAGSISDGRAMHPTNAGPPDVYIPPPPCSDVAASRHRRRCPYWPWPCHHVTRTPVLYCTPAPLIRPPNARPENRYCYLLSSELTRGVRVLCIKREVDLLWRGSSSYFSSNRLKC